ncbi:hypothetical protein GLOIN_2v1722037 [Rhizophagus irregularis DAOM 181602=DAOM 197198]|nr:hypothetical protein GLOIN_2v1722037 [Rhizophagus irregularis DAOM 181602=DAOM 197198]
MELIRKIYGGYNPIGFTNSNRKYPASDSFIFSFENGEDIQNMKISRPRLSGQLTDRNFEGLDDSRTEFRRSTGSRVQSTSRFRVLENGSAVQMSSEERKKPSFISFGGLPIFGKRGTKIYSGRLLSSEERKTKIRSGGLPKIRGTKIRNYSEF